MKRAASRTRWRGADAVIITTEWDEYRQQDWAVVLQGMRQRLVIDTRNILTWRPEGVTLEQIGKRVASGVQPTDDLNTAFSDGVLVAPNPGPLGTSA